MRIERTGEIAPLTPRVVRFLQDALQGINLDNVQSPSILRADFSCLGGLLAIELKSLEEDASERIDNLTGELRVLPETTKHKNMEMFTHMMVEMAERAIPASEFPYSVARHKAAAIRLGFGKSVLQWIDQMNRDASAP